MCKNYQREKKSKNGMILNQIRTLLPGNCMEIDFSELKSLRYYEKFQGTSLLQNYSWKKFSRTFDFKLIRQFKTKIILWGWSALPPGLTKGHEGHKVSSNLIKIIFCEFSKIYRRRRRAYKADPIVYNLNLFS